MTSLSERFKENAAISHIVDARKAAAIASAGFESLIAKQVIWGKPVATVTRSQIDQWADRFEDSWKSIGDQLEAEGHNHTTLKDQYLHNRIEDRMSHFAQTRELWPHQINEVTNEIMERYNNPATIDNFFAYSWTGRDAQVVFLDGQDFTLETLGDEFTYLPDAANLPGTPEQWAYAIAEHEYGHVAGGGEYQADKIMATKYAQRFGTQDGVLHAFADIRAINAVIQAETNANAVYGWGTVEAVDLITSLEQGLIDDISNEQILAMHDDDQAKDFYDENLSAFVIKLRAANPDAWRDKLTKELASTANDLLERGAFGEAGGSALPGRAVAQRFIRAYERLTHPEPEESYNIRYKGLEKEEPETIHEKPVTTVEPGGVGLTHVAPLTSNLSM